MEIVNILLIAVGLAMDAFAVSVASGAIHRDLHIVYKFRMAFFFGLFQAVMPVIGWLAGNTIIEKIDSFDHWVAFGLLVVMGLKMIYEAFKIEEAEKNINPSNLTVLLALSVATSIDALAVGITLSLITSHVIVAVIAIGLVTFVLSMAGVEIGKRFGHLFEDAIEVVGGLVLIGIGSKILIESLFFGG